MKMDEVLEKGKAAKNPEELKAMAANEGWQMTDEEAAQNFDALQKRLWKLADGLPEHHMQRMGV